MFGHCRAANSFVRIAPPPVEASRRTRVGIGDGSRRGMLEAFDFFFLAFVLRDMATRFGVGIERPSLVRALQWPEGCQSAARDVEAADHDGGTIGFSPNPMGPGLARRR
ncbi:hypothetical protein CJU37_07115 [Pseudomonas aeruginosa]|nr:hypothetical protein CJU38_05080 [Pseudomonas aeruginosa]PCA55930.1 hypothetical protein CJU37_07115 [Pseudomonas aeruginosa]